VQILNGLHADEYLLDTMTRNYHWTVVGPQFNDLHKFCDTQYEELYGFVDVVAERARSLGGRAACSLAEFARNARLKESAGDVPDARGMIAGLLADHEAVVRVLRGDLETCAQRFGAAGTSDFLTGLMEQHEKMAWMLRAFQA